MTDTETQLYEDALNAVETLIGLCDTHGPEAVRDAITEARDTPDEDATPFANALFEAIQGAIAEAQDVDNGHARLVMTPAMGERITWSWLHGASPHPGYRNAVLDSVARMLGHHVPASDPAQDEGLTE